MIDDEEKILRLVSDILSDQYDVITSTNGEEGIDKAQAEKPDLILVDMVMPKLNGVETTKFLRRCLATSQTPIIMLTALKEPEDRTEGFEAGVDDFISKPFHPTELKSRIKNKINRFKTISSGKRESLELGNLKLDAGKQSVHIDGKAIHIPKIEFAILRELLLHAEEILSREYLLKRIWGDKDVDDRILDQHVTILRKKLTAFDHKIRAVYGRGYTVRKDET